MPDYYKAIRKEKDRENNHYEIKFVRDLVHKLHLQTKYHDKRPDLFEKTNQFAKTLKIYQDWQKKYPNFIVDLDYGFYKNAQMIIWIESKLGEDSFTYVMQLLHSKDKDQKTRKENRALAIKILEANEELIETNKGGIQ